MAWSRHASRRSCLLLYGYVTVELWAWGYLLNCWRRSVSSPFFSPFSFIGVTFIFDDIVAACKLVKVAILTPFVAIVESTKLWRLIAVCLAFVALLSSLSFLVSKCLQIYSSWVYDISANVTSDWLSFIGYCINFELLYAIFSFYAVSFIGFCLVLFSLYVISFVASVFPTAITIIKQLLDTLTGD